MEFLDINLTKDFESLNPSYSVFLLSTVFFKENQILFWF